MISVSWLLVNKASIAVNYTNLEGLGHLGVIIVVVNVLRCSMGQVSKHILHLM